MNNDGFPDFVLNETDQMNNTVNYICIHHNYGKLVSITQPDTVITDSIITSVCTEDFNNDGIEDIAYCTSVFPTPSGVGGHNSIRILYMDASGDTLYREVYNGDDYPFWTLGMPVSIQSADFNNDGFADVFVTCNGVDLILFNNTIGGFSVNDLQFPGGGDLYHTAVIGDVNGDGWQDLIYNYVIGANENASTSYMPNENGQFNTGSYIIEKEMAFASNSAIADFNGDGALDVVSNWYNGLYVHFNSEVNNLEQAGGNLANRFVLTSKYPNPFNVETNINFFMPVRGAVESKIYDLNGKEVKIFTNEHCHPGWNRQKWNGKNNSGREVSSGIYIWKFSFQGRNIAQKIILTK